MFANVARIETVNGAYMGILVLGVQITNLLVAVAQEFVCRKVDVASIEKKVEHEADRWGRTERSFTKPCV